jgi:hypothetical protein
MQQLSTIHCRKSHFLKLGPKEDKNNLRQWKLSAKKEVINVRGKPYKLTKVEDVLGRKKLYFFSGFQKKIFLQCCYSNVFLQKTTERFVMYFEGYILLQFQYVPSKFWNRLFW